MATNKNATLTIDSTTMPITSNSISNSISNTITTLNSNITDYSNYTVSSSGLVSSNIYIGDPISSSTSTAVTIGGSNYWNGISTDSYQEQIQDIVERELKKQKEKENKKMSDYNFGAYTNSDIRLSNYGIAIKNKMNKWVSYDKQKQRLMDVDILNIPIETSKIFYKIPRAVEDIEPGDIIIHNDTILIVEENNGNRFLAINPYEGTEQTVLPSISPFGYDYITCIVNLMENLPQADANNPFGAALPFMLSGKNNNNGLLLALTYADGQIDPMMLALMSNTDITPFLLMQMLKKKSKKDYNKRAEELRNAIKATRRTREDIDE